jgi:integrase
MLVAYRHGLRASEVVVLRWDDVDLATGRLHVRRAKGGDASVSAGPLLLGECQELRRKSARQVTIECSYVRDPKAVEDGKM